MADKKISQLTGATTPLAGTEVLPIVQSGSTVKVSVADLTAGRVTTVSRITATGGVGTPSSNSQFGYTSTAGAVITGTGSSFDVQLQNKSNQNCLAIPTGTRDVSLAAGNLVIGTAGKGINFTANTPAAGMTSQLLNWYEEGTFTPTVTASSGTFTTVSASGTYTRIGRAVSFSLTITITNAGTASGACIATLPFTASQENVITMGRETNATGYSLQGTILSGYAIVAIQKYDNTGMIATGNVLTMSGTYFV